MSIEITNNYMSYATSYKDSTKSNSAKSEKSDVTATESTKKEGNTTRKTAMDELTYLSKKYSNYSFVVANYTQGMKYGSPATVNVAISPQFLSKMANDPELEAEYEKQIEGMYKIDEELISGEAAKGWRLETGWAIDKDGGISKWQIITKDPNAKSHLQKTSENAEKIRIQNAEKKQEEEKIADKQQETKEEKAELQKMVMEKCKEQFGDQFKRVIISEKDEISNLTQKNDSESFILNMQV